MREHGQNTDNLHNDSANGRRRRLRAVVLTSLCGLAFGVVPAVGLEPTTIGLKGHCSTD